MFGPSLENALILSLVQLLLSGLVFLVLCVTLWRERQRGTAPPAFGVLALVFFLLSSHLLLASVDAYLELSGPETSAHFRGLHLAVQALETLAFLSLLVAYLPRAAGGHLRLLAFPAWAGEPAAAQINLILLAVVVWLGFHRRERQGWFAVWPPLAVLVSMACRAGQGIAGEAWRGRLWSAEKILMLASLVLFALLVERRTRSLHLQVFVRLNLIFIVVATLLVLVMTHAERRQFLAFEQTRLEEFSEFLRGHALYYHRRGHSAEEIFNSPEIVRKVVSEFGLIPDLRVVRLFLHGARLEMSINKAGEVDQSVDRAGDGPAGEKVRFLRGERVSTLVVLSIYDREQTIGRVELDETLTTIDAAIGGQIRSIFGAFTLLVLVSGMLISLTVRDANRTIQSQYEEIDRANRQLLQAAKLASVGELAGGVAHEINNPAGVILARTDYMLAVARQEGIGGELVEGVEVVRQQARRISEIVRGLLTFARPSPLQVRKIDLNEVVERNLALVGPQCQTAGITLHRRFAQGLPPLEADPDRLGQVFVNILNNAIGAMPQGGTLSVTTELRDSHTAFVKISDTGCGIPEERLRKIFDPFFTTKKAGQGTGLGLAVSYGIIRDHGGEIQVESAAGRGSTFIVLLPVKR
ncbi:MAG: ATP-binding protein [Acidobacteriota bacterium]